MRTLPKLTLEFVYMRNLTTEELDRFDLWVKTYKGQVHRWSDNHELLIPYEVYEAWCRHEDDLALLEKLKEIMTKGS